MLNMIDMLSVKRQVKVIEGCTPSTLTPDILQSTEPLLLKGLVGQWPAVVAAKTDNSHFCDYLLSQCQPNAPVNTFVAPASQQGRFFYDPTMTGFNFSRGRATIAQVINRLRDETAAGSFSADGPLAESLYMGSTAVDHCLPSFQQHNPMTSIEKPMVSAWLGNQTRIAAHYDVPDNIACVVAGQRRFTLFAPEQIDNLYIGPLDFTPAGQAISLVDFAAPDFNRFPRFSQAIEQAQVAVLEPGDAIMIPSMWWHHVEALSPMNLLINYWWRSVPGYLGAPMDAMYHALLSLRELPPAQRQAWAKLFDYYVFNPNDSAVCFNDNPNLTDEPLIDEKRARQLRAMLLNKLNR